MKLDGILFSGPSSTVPLTKQNSRNINKNSIFEIYLETTF